MTPQRSWKVNVPKPLSTSSRPILKRPVNIESKVEKKVENKIENVEKKIEKAIEQKKKIDIVLQTKSEHTEREWSAIMFSIYLNNLNNLSDSNNINKIMNHLDTIPSFFHETGMFTMSLDIVISRIKVDVQDVTIESYYKNTNMADDIFLDDIASWPTTELLFYF
jgi:Ni,Fe-hydrogenase I large subunit